ncbi:hypothetical protein DFH08DRAFT_983461 [Mycena albidolilacea]|uniref:Uncharacterized protein n=1 Tax=Mycena albidolilacea TaxID=1033008 RepID=A0AAD7AVR4_9AGAR|nr:hypothetical protein DFH08DRAFT_983461 [Mycena albidolilacea]
MRFSTLRSGDWFVKEKGSLTTEKNESFVTGLGVEGASMLLLGSQNQKDTKGLKNTRPRAPVDEEHMGPTEVHCNNVTTHIAISVCKVKGTVGGTTDELQIGDAGCEIDSGYFHEPRTELVAFDEFGSTHILFPGSVQGPANGHGIGLGRYIRPRFRSVEYPFYYANELFPREVLEIFVVRSTVNEAALDQFHDQRIPDSVCECDAVKNLLVWRYLCREQSRPAKTGENRPQLCKCFLLAEEIEVDGYDGSHVADNISQSNLREVPRLKIL